MTVIGPHRPRSATDCPVGDDGGAGHKAAGIGDQQKAAGP